MGAGSLAPHRIARALSTVRVYGTFSKACLVRRGRVQVNAAVPGGAPGMPKSLLLADDSTTIRTAVGMVFKKEDFALTTVANGTEALERARDLKPDLILADVDMPGLTGYELCEKVRSDAVLKQTPILLLGGGTPVDPSRAIAVGANGQMAKPFDSQKLIDQVKQILANPKPMVAGAQGPAAPAATPKPSVPPPPRPSGPPPQQV